jgi:rhodanese-related sulfurtransferase
VVPVLESPTSDLYPKMTVMDPDKALQQAKERGKAMGLPYEGALTPQEAHAVLQQAKGSQLVDVRTRAEWDWVGRIPGAVEIELLTYPGNRPNADFVKQLEQQVDKDSPVLFICRSGGRSHNAAMMATQAGYSECYNVLEGFEGDKNESGQRGKKGGWRAAGLPWVQS